MHRGDTALDSTSSRGPSYSTSGFSGKRKRRDVFDEREAALEESSVAGNRLERSVHDSSLPSKLRLRIRRSMIRRRERAAGYQVAKEIAKWDGRNLTVTGIVWPGEASKPPTGKPAKYTLRVVTWKEDPQVKYTPLRETTDPNESPCDANSLPCQIYERNATNHRISNETVDACCTGLCIDLLKKLGEMLHFDVNLTEVDEGAYGSPLNVSYNDKVKTTHAIDYAMVETTNDILEENT
ncbi:glutamate receptor ionotropic, NMDA 2B-like [Elysia marginata]|uniref:Glutamate receptor ionotropic, NMDA 2B-like n=1 Tax=Elysia marginata TaxID=1093978 RepID=A0AAV4GVY3_9GAST|nr:glutamate receptor ionotropic, NMDA 2B-like [Elysia marginata]